MIAFPGGDHECRGCGSGRGLPGRTMLADSCSELLRLALASRRGTSTSFPAGAWGRQLACLHALGGALLPQAWRLMG